MADTLEEGLARAICETLFGPFNVEEFPYTPSCVSQQSRDAASAALAYLREQGVLVEPVNQDTCKHTSAHSFGALSSDGSGLMEYYCQTCHKSWHTETPSRTPERAP